MTGEKGAEDKPKAEKLKRAEEEKKRRYRSRWNFNHLVERHPVKFPRTMASKEVD